MACYKIPALPLDLSEKVFLPASGLLGRAPLFDNLAAGAVPSAGAGDTETKYFSLSVHPGNMDPTLSCQTHRTVCLTIYTFLLDRSDFCFVYFYQNWEKRTCSLYCFFLQKMSSPPAGRPKNAQLHPGAFDGRLQKTGEMTSVWKKHFFNKTCIYAFQTHAYMLYFLQFVSILFCFMFPPLFSVLGLCILCFSKQVSNRCQR